MKVLQIYRFLKWIKHFVPLLSDSIRNRFAVGFFFTVLFLLSGYRLYANHPLHKTAVTGITLEYAEWNYYKKITINTSATGAGINTNQTGYPLLVRLNASNFDFSQTMTDGEDIRFVKSDGTALNYEIERWDNALQLAEIWVKIDTVYGNNANQYIGLRWGNTAVTSLSDGKGVFETGFGFVGVWHLGEEGGVVQYAYKDATAYNHHGTGQNMTETADVDGIIGRAQIFDGVDDYIMVDDDDNLEPSAITISAWINIISTSIYKGNILHKGLNSAYRYRVTLNSQLEFINSESNPKNILTSDVGSINENQWIYTAISGDASGIKMYANGILLTSNTVGLVQGNTTRPLEIGSCAFWKEYFNGIIDEARVENTARSADWIKLNYEIQRSDQKVVTVAPGPGITKPTVTVNSQKTTVFSPEITGTVSDTGAVVTVTVNEKNYSAEVLGDGQWRLAAGIVADLQSGVYDVIATAVNVLGEGVDNTIDELEILQLYPEIEFTDLLTNIPSPEISGTINDPEATVTVSLLDSVYSAVNQGTGVWLLAAGIIASLPEDTIQIIVSAINKYNFTTTDTGVVILDLSVPVVTGLSPRDNRTNPQPSLNISFNEIVFMGQGNIFLVPEAPLLQTYAFDVTSANVIGWGTDRLSFTPDSALNLGTDYHVLIDSGCVKDGVGNFYEGISDSSYWKFTIGSSNDPFIDSIAPVSSPGWYNKGDTIRIRIHFSQQVSLTGGDARAKLETGNDDGIIVISPFALTDFIDLEYVVRIGDSTQKLDFINIETDPGAIAANNDGNLLIFSLNAGNNLSTRGIYKVDGIPPGIKELSPVTNAVVMSTLTEYTLEQDVYSCMISWGEGKYNNIPLTGEESIQTKNLSGEYLKAGTHSVLMDEQKLRKGATYKVSILVADSAGNTSSTSNLLVRLTLPPSVLIVRPRDTSVSMQERFFFRAFGIDTIGGGNTEIPLDSVVWSASGAGLINSSGFFAPYNLGKATVIASLGIMTDTVNVSVTSTVNSFKRQGDTVQVGGNIELIVPPMAGAVDTAITITDYSSLLLPANMVSAGPAIVFQAVGNNPPLVLDSIAILRFRIDTTLIGVGQDHKVQVYRKTTYGYVLSSSVLKNGWLTIQTDTLGTFIMAVDIEQPQVTLISPVQEVRDGSMFNITYRASDNIYNPQAFLHLYKGGIGDSIVTLSYIKNKEQKIEIPANKITLKGFGYALEITDGVNSTFSEVIDMKITNREAIQSVAGSFQSGMYQMISIPLIPQHNYRDSLLT
ncbi:MAG: DUF2341 domain-containing protein, partial [Fibrobacteria bacterium]|nr:DUF2341 domain-containing protein [Fibrobacteria bacterium]